MLGNLAAWFTGALEGVLDVPASTSESDKGLIDLQCGRTVFNDVPVKMRTELWMSQLQRKRGTAAEAIARYPSLATTALHPDVISEIEKDTHRTYPNHVWLSGPVGQLSLLRILRAYAAYDPEVGYTQGMNFLAGLLLAYLEEPQAFGAMVVVMQERGLRDLYRPDDGMALLQVRLWQLGRLLPPRLGAHLEAHAALPVLYASSWFLTCFAADFPMHFAARVMDLVVTDCYAAPLMKVAVHLVERCEGDLLRITDLEEMVDLLRRQVPRWPRGKLQDLLTEALGRGWTSRQSAVLREINGAESVADAVARVDAALATGGPGVEYLEPAKSEERSSGFMKDGVRDTPPASPHRTKSGTMASLGTTPGAGIGQGLPAKLLPLPPPPTSRKDKVEWQRWRPSTPALKSLPSDSIRIDPELHETALDPRFSKELSTYLNNISSAAMSGRAQHAASKPREDRDTLEELPWKEEEEDKSIQETIQEEEKQEEESVQQDTVQSTTIVPSSITRVVSSQAQARTSSDGVPSADLESPFSGPIPSPFESCTVSNAASSIDTHSELASVHTGEFSEFTGAGDSSRGSHSQATPSTNDGGGPTPQQQQKQPPEHRGTSHHHHNINHSNDLLTNDTWNRSTTANSVTGLLADMSIRTLDYSWPSSKEESRGVGLSKDGSPAGVKSGSETTSPAQLAAKGNSSGGLKPVSEGVSPARAGAAAAWEPNFPKAGESGFASFKEADESVAGGEERSEQRPAAVQQTSPTKVNASSVASRQEESIKDPAEMRELALSRAKESVAGGEGSEKMPVPQLAARALLLQQAHLKQFLEAAKSPNNK